MHHACKTDQNKIFGKHINHVRLVVSDPNNHLPDMIPRVKIVECSPRVLEIKDIIDDWGQRHFLLFQKSVQVFEILFRTNSDSSAEIKIVKHLSVAEGSW